MGLPTPEAFDKLSQSVGPALRALLRPSQAVQAELMGIPIPAITVAESNDEDRLTGNLSKPVAGELYTDGISLLAVYITNVVEPRRRSSVSLLNGPRLLDGGAEDQLPFELTVFSVTSSPERAHAEIFVKAVDSAFTVKLAERPFVNKKFQELLTQEGRFPPLPPTETQKRSARQLADRGLRSLAISIRAAGGLLTRDLPKQLGSEFKDCADDLRARLEQHGLASSEFVVVCRKTQSSIATIPSRDALASLSDIGVKCSCGRPIAEEDVQEALAVTDLCNDLLDGSKWLTLLLLEELEHVGVAPGDTLIEQQFGGDEIDCLAVISGELVLFELKDKDFNLGNAYPFGAKVGFIQPDHSVILSTKRIGNDAREHFERARVGKNNQYAPWQSRSEDKIRYIEGVERLAHELRELASSIYSEDAKRLLDEVLSHGSLRPDQMLALFSK